MSICKAICYECIWYARVLDKGHDVDFYTTACTHDCTKQQNCVTGAISYLYSCCYVKNDEGQCEDFEPLKTQVPSLKSRSGWHQRYLNWLRGWGS